MTDNYTGENIQVIENLDAVRKRPGMYIGDTNSGGLHHLINEIVDNGIDEHLAGYANELHVTLKPSNIIIVEDNGRGVPVDIHPKTKRPTIETIFTVLHAGGKFGGKSSVYKVSGGLHGVGSSVVTALSKYVKVWVYKNKKHYEILFDDGGRKISKLKVLGNTTKTGTRVEFKPNDDIFSTISFNGKKIAERLKQKAFLNPGLKIIFDDQKNESKYEYSFENGIIDFVNELSLDHKQLTNAHLFHNKMEGIDYSFAFKYTNLIGEKIISFANDIHTIDGGSHETAFKVSLSKAINEYINEHNLKKNNLILDGEDIRESIIAVISVLVSEEHLQFEGQTKTKLSSLETKRFIERDGYKQIKHYLNTHTDEANLIIDKAYKSKMAKEAAKRARQVTRELNKTSKKSFVGKLVKAQSKKSIERELFIVEGDSAGGSAKLGRDRKYQAILPLKGKIINSEKATMKQLVANEELTTIIHAIGGGISDDYNIKKCNYGKIIIMTDADTDGAHIQSLLLTFFYRFMNDLIINGRIYIAMPPLYKLTVKGKNKNVYYAWEETELNDLRKKHKSYEIQRYKGLGEMNYEQLWDTTMNPKTRKLVKVTINEIEDANKIIETLMGQDASLRREWIEENIDFNEIDNFIDIEKGDLDV